MILCEGCLGYVTVTPIETAFGVFESPFALCRSCWGKVSPELRKLFRLTLRGFKAWPTFERSLVTYEVWLLCRGEELNRGYRVWDYFDARAA